MNIKTKLMQTLKPLGIPLYFMTNFEAKEDTYMVFFIEKVSQHTACENEEESTKYELLLHIYSKSDYDDLSENVIKLLKEQGFRRRYEAEDYDNTTNFYIKAIKIDYINYNLF